MRSLVVGRLNKFKRYGAQIKAPYRKFAPALALQYDRSEAGERGWSGSSSPWLSRLVSLAKNGIVCLSIKPRAAYGGLTSIASGANLQLFPDVRVP